MLGNSGNQHFEVEVVVYYQGLEWVVQGVWWVQVDVVEDETVEGLVGQGVEEVE